MSEEERPGLTREAIVATARDLIQSDGLQALSLRRVGRELGVTAPALYAYVSDKSDLLRAVAEEEFGVLLERFAAVSGLDPVSRMAAMSRAYIDFAAERPELFKVMFLFPPELTISDTTGAELPIATQAFGYAIDSITEAMEAGALRDDLDPTLVTFVSWVAGHGLATVLNLGFEFDQDTRDQLIDLVLDTVVRGLAPGND